MLPLFDPPAPDVTRTTYAYPDGDRTAIVTVTATPGRVQVAVKCSCPRFAIPRRHRECAHVHQAVRQHRLVAVVAGVLYNFPQDIIDRYLRKSA